MNIGKRTRERILSALTIALFAALLVLLTALFLAYRQNSADTVPFDLGEITADKTVDATDISDCFLPAFIGVTVNGEHSALIGSERTMAELYAMLSPALSEAFDSGTSGRAARRTGHGSSRPITRSISVITPSCPPPWSRSSPISRGASLRGIRGPASISPSPKPSSSRMSTARTRRPRRSGSPTGPSRS